MVQPTKTPPREGSLEAPTRHAIPWQTEDFYDEQALDAELRRVFDICHGCRRCFNLCDSFPKLFDLIDDSATGELDAVDSKDFKPVVDACTLCDMCFMTKCPYVPPHEFDLDFPHLMLRYRAVEAKKGEVGFARKQLARTDRNGKLATLAPGVVNWASACGNRLTRPALEKTAGIDRNAALPRFHGQTWMRRARKNPPPVNAAAPAFGREATLYATCFVNYNNPDAGCSAHRVMAHNGVAVTPAWQGCCGMPQLEHGALADVASRARRIAAALRPGIDAARPVVVPVPSCALMMKFEWPLLVPDDPDVAALAGATRDLSEYLVELAGNEGMTPGMKPLEGGATLHVACHARAQNIGRKAADLLRQIPDTPVHVIERCSGHGGSWGIMKDNFDTALKVGKPVARQAVRHADRYVVSECPLAADHILQGMDRLTPGAAPARGYSPVELVARAYGLDEDRPDPDRPDVDRPDRDAAVPRREAP